MFWCSITRSVPVVLGRQAELGRIRRRLLADVVRELAAMLVIAMKCAMPAPKPRCSYASLMARHGGLGVLGVRQQGGQRRLVGHQRADVVRVRGDEGQGIDGAAAAGEQVNRLAAYRLDDPMQVIGVLARFGLRAWSSLVLRSAPRGS